jgi:predicted lipid-binding transport protein (Tim44 family)
MPEIDLPTVIFALVALFVAWKLRSVLGMRQDSDSERPGGLLAPLRRVPGASTPPVAQPGATPSAPAPTLAADRWKGVAEPNSAVWSGLDAIAEADRGFSPQAFLAGAKGAYDMVVHAFAAGDSDALKSLMSPEAFANFESAIHTRADAGHTMSTTVVSIDNATIDGAGLIGQTARISVRFAAKLASVTRDGQGEVVDGSANTVVEHIDLWTFTRDVRSRDPNWQLTATESES